MTSPLPNDRPNKIGVITQGSLSKGLEMKLDASVSIESVMSGTFAVIQGKEYDFFSMITDVRIDASNEDILLYPPAQDDVLLREILQGDATYATVSLKPMLMLPNQTNQELLQEEARSVKTIPSHFSLVAKATEDDIARIFGHETHADGTLYFHMGSPLGMDDIPVCINLERFVERSNAVFGKTGTGKTFLTRLLLSGTIKNERAVNLIFDMHSEYGLGAGQEGGGKQFVKGLKELFPSKVAVFSLDPQSTRRRGAAADHDVYLYADQILPEDIMPLRDTLSLNATAAESAFLVRQRYKNQWLQRILDTDAAGIEALAEECGANQSSLGALKRKLAPFTQYDFFLTEPSKGKQDIIKTLLEYIDQGKSIVLEFGRYDALKVYLLVANVLTRRLRDAYEEKTSLYLQTRNEADKPKPLIITIEEAHKFLSPGIARETPFGKIAREMRKFFVSLLVVDQRPSAIDEEVLSQIGTKLVAQLSDEKDINATLVGTSNASGLRQVLSSLDSKQQALALGHAVPMPVVMKTRMYDDDFYKAMQGEQASFEDTKDEIKGLFY
ncbi:MAG: ATP-binding protein [Rhodothermaceae bacterium]|nr:ATP-binding protein [Rhodothermaceae bacterium]